jgi:hypothetical protein
MLLGVMTHIALNIPMMIIVTISSQVILFRVSLCIRHAIQNDAGYLLEPLSKRWATIVVARIDIKLLLAVVARTFVRGSPVWPMPMTICSSIYRTFASEETHNCELWG